MFQLPHLLVLLGATALSLSACRWANRAAPASVELLLKACAVAALAFDPAYWIWEWRSFGQLDLSQTLPLYLCSLFWMLLPAAFLTCWPRLCQIARAAICTIGTLGGIFGLVFNVYLNRYPFFSFVPLRSLLYHVLMVVVAAVMWASGFYRPQPEDRWRCFYPVLLLLGVCLICNHCFGWDYCYTAGGLGTPLERLSSRLPRGAFLLLLYGGLLGLIQLLFYRNFYLQAFRKRNRQAQPPILS